MKRSKFSLSHYKLFTCDMGYLIPISWYEVLPGDSIQQATAALVRVSPLLAPVMHPVRVRVHHWFVPFRLIWEDWEDFITGGPDGADSSAVPYYNLSSCAEGGLLDYLGIPVAAYDPVLRVCALPNRAYNLIYNEHYRDQDLVTPIVVDLGSGGDGTTTRNLQRCGWEKDYFTTARPWEQKGAEVSIPLANDRIKGIGINNQTFPSAGLAVYESDGTHPTYANYRSVDNSADAYTYIEKDPDSNYPRIRLADGSIALQDLRLAAAIQRYQEARAIYGSRYVEYLRYLGVRSSDARLQKPEYLGGGRQIIQFSEVLQTAEGTDPVADMKGHGLAAMRTRRWRRFFEEHGIVMTIMSVVPKTIYASGVHRSFTRLVKEDFFQKELQFIGEQAVLNKEVYAPHNTPDGVFGYQARYDEYRSLPSQIAGEFWNTLSHWHYARIFGSEPALNQAFIEADVTKRVNASSNTDCLYVMANHSVQARRMMASKPSGVRF